MSTDAESLILAKGSAPAIWEDLGSGRSYGTFTVLPYVSIYQRWDTSVFDLNNAALEDITSALAAGSRSVAACRG